VVNRRSGTRRPTVDELCSEIALARAELAETIQALAAKADLRSRAQTVGADLRSRAGAARAGPRARTRDGVARLAEAAARAGTRSVPAGRTLSRMALVGRRDGRFLAPGARADKLGAVTRYRDHHYSAPALVPVARRPRRARWRRWWRPAAPAARSPTRPPAGPSVNCLSVLDRFADDSPIGTSLVTA